MAVNVMYRQIFVENSGVCDGVRCLVHCVIGSGDAVMMGERRVDRAALFYESSLERHVPRANLLRSIDGL